MGKATKNRKPRLDPTTKMAQGILPEAQVARGGLAIRDVANHSDNDQKDSLSLKRTQTVRRRTRVELLRDAGIITTEQMAACEWYAAAHQIGYDTVGCTANYLGAGGSGFGSSDLFARYRAQAEARENYLFARQAIPGHLIGLFDRIVLGPMDIRTLTKEDRLRFSLAAFLLQGQIGHLLMIAA